MERDVWVAALTGIESVALDFRGDSVEVNLGVFSYWSAAEVLVESEICTQRIACVADLAPVIRTHLLAIEAARRKEARAAEHKAS